MSPHAHSTALLNPPSDLQFTATTLNIIPIYQLISSIIPFGKNCLLNITNEGLCFSIVDNNICKILLTLDRRLFGSFLFSPRRTSNRSKEVDTSHKKRKDKGNKDAQDTDVHQEAGSNTEGSTDSESTDISTSEETDEETDTVDSISINLDLKSLIETINIHIPSDRDSLDFKTKCILSYRNEGDPFILTFEDEFIIERCELLTLFIDPNDHDLMASRKKKQTKKLQGKAGNNAKFTNHHNIDDDDDNEFNGSLLTDNSIFQIDTSKLMFEIIMKSSILYDVLKDMKDLNTDEFIIYCSKESLQNNRDMHDSAAGRETASKNRLVFISRSEDDAIGYSKVIIPEKKPFLKDMQVYKPVFKESDANDILNGLPLNDCDNNDSVEMIPSLTNISSFYNFGYFSKIIRCIKLSKLIKIRKDLNGLTSLSLLISSSNLSSGHYSSTDGKSIYYGTSIEFVTLESIPSEDRYLTLNNIQSSLSTAESQFLPNGIDRNYLKYGYHNQSIEQMIKDDENIKVIRVAGDGQFTTIDDFFQPNYNYDDHFRAPHYDNHQSSNLNTASNVPEQTSNARPHALNITNELAKSLLGHPSTITHIDDSGPSTDLRKNPVESIEVNETACDDETGKEDQMKSRGKRRLPATSSKDKGGKNSKPKKKKKSDGIQMVGGAIEIPLFI